MINPLTYLQILAKEQPLSFKALREAQIANLALGKLYTVNSVYRRDLVKAQYDLYEYFNRSLHRPFNCLLLGPPGSGKSFIAKQLADLENRADFAQLSDFGIDTKGGGLQPGGPSDRVTRAKFFEYNLSQLHRPDEITQIFRDIARLAAEPKIVLLDEFDVKIGSSSVIRYLIEPMYDGKVAGTELGKTAFIFSGSYLSNKELLGRLQREKSQIDLPKFMFDYYYKVAIKNGKGTRLGHEVYNLFHTCDVYRRYQEEMTPERDITLYLRQLDKFWDFLSRINGFVMEVPDISAPLDTTDPPAALLTGKFPCCSRDERVPICSRGGGVAEKLIEWLEIETTLREIQTRQRGEQRALSQRFTYYDAEFEPILQYKDMLLKERLHALLTMFDNERKNRREKKEPKGNAKWTNDTVVVMKRSLLNYLCTAPLVHGMRSLSTLMWNLKAEEGRPHKDGQPGADPAEQWDNKGRENYTITLGDPEKVARHVRQEGDYQDPQTVWGFLQRSNDLGIDGDSDIDIILDGGGGSLRVWDEPYKASRAIRSDQIRARNIIGQRVYNLSADEIGRVKELVIDKDGKVGVAVIDIGDFVGAPGKHVDVALSQIRTSNSQLTLNATKEQLQEMTEYSLGT